MAPPHRANVPALRLARQQRVLAALGTVGPLTPRARILRYDCVDITCNAKAAR